jgi:hypothetical protein
MKIDPRQLSFDFGRAPGPLQAPDHDRRLPRILHAAQVMQMNTARPARELYAPRRLGVWMRGMIKERV